MDKKISIAMAVYNGAKYIREQLDSIYSQSRLPDEVIISDDHSTDGTVAILEEYHKKYGLKYTVNSTNLGVNKNFELALRNTTGDYVLLSDHDDVWFSNKVETLVDAIMEREQPGEPCLICSRVIDVDSQLRPMANRYTNTDGKEKDWTYNLCGGFTQGCTMIVNRTAVEKVLPLPSQFMFDAYIGLTVNMTGQWYDICEPLMYYRHHSSNVVARVNTGEKKSLFKRLKSDDPLPFILDNKRFELMDYVAERFIKDFKSSKVDLFNRVRRYKNFSKLQRVSLILQSPCANLRVKVRSILSLVIS